MIPRWARWLGLSVGLVGLALGVTEGSLRAVPALMLWSRQLPVVPLASGDTLIVVMGDSVPYGYGVSSGQSWPGQLALVLKARGETTVQVSNVARPGARSDTLLKDQLSAVEDAPEGVAVRVYAQVGHNDYTMYGGTQHTPGMARINIPQNEPWWWDLRVARILRWWGEAATESSPPTRLGQEAQDDFALRIRELHQQIVQRGATLTLVTYLIPGEAGRDQDPQAAIGLNEVRRVQLEVNQLLRRTSASQQIPLLDLAWIVSGSPSFDPAWFQDGVHTTAGANRAIAEAVAAGLE